MLLLLACSFGPQKSNFAELTRIMSVLQHYLFIITTINRIDETYVRILLNYTHIYIMYICIFDFYAYLHIYIF